MEELTTVPYGANFIAVVLIFREVSKPMLYLQSSKLVSVIFLIEIAAT